MTMKSVQRDIYVDTNGVHFKFGVLGSNLHLSRGNLARGGVEVTREHVWVCYSIGSDGCIHLIFPDPCTRISVVLFDALKEGLRFGLHP